MNIYISGISGTGMGPLALLAQDAGMKVFGSDLAAGAITDELVDHGVMVCLGVQDGNFLKTRAKNEGVDWFIHTSSLPENNPELVLAKKMGIKVSKRDEFLNYLIKKLKLKLIAVAGTHGKTTTTAMIVWMAQQLDIPLSYLVGTTLPFAQAGHYEPGSEYFVYEADEYDRNFLAFKPWLAVIPNVSYDHPDIYPTVEDYQGAFEQFEKQSRDVVYGNEIAAKITLAGEARRYDATLALDVIQRIMPKPRGLMRFPAWRRRKLLKAINNFPGVGRRFEQVSEGYYSDYAHHPEEVKATIEIALEEVDRRGLKGAVVVYEPHQNTRQAELIDDYAEVFMGVTKLYWVPTFLTRENDDLRVIKPAQFIGKLKNKTVAEAAKLDDELAEKLKDWHKKGYLILLMSAGPADAWIRKLVYAGNQESAATRLVYVTRSAEEGSEELQK